MSREALWNKIEEKITVEGRCYGKTGDIAIPIEWLDKFSEQQIATIHTIFYYDDYLIIIMNGGKGLVTAENIPLKSIENSLIIDISGTFSGSSVCQPAPP